MKPLNLLLKTALLNLAALNVAYASDMYGVLSAGYVENETSVNELDTASYKIAIGYQVARQWYIEGGYQLLADENAGETPSLDEPSSELNGLYIAALGKASGDSGELFYRLGLMRADLDERFLSSQDCAQLGFDAYQSVNGLNQCGADDTAPVVNRHHTK